MNSMYLAWRVLNYAKIKISPGDPKVVGFDLHVPQGYTPVYLMPRACIGCQGSYIIHGFMT